MGQGTDPRESNKNVKAEGRPVVRLHRSHRHHWRQRATGPGVVHAGGSKGGEGVPLLLGAAGALCPDRAGVQLGLHYGLCLSLPGVAL